MTVSVLHVSQPTTEGVARWVALLAADQVRRGWNVAVASPDDGNLAADIDACGARHVLWSATRSPGPKVPSEVMTLRRIVKDLKPDVVHLHSSKAGLAGRLAVAGRTPTLFQPHSWSVNAVNGPVRAATAGWERLGALLSTRIICVSDAEKAEGIRLGISAKRLVVIHNGIDTAAWPVAEAEDRVNARTQLALSHEAPIVVCVGRLSEQKGQDLLLDAWPAVLTEVPNAELYLIGDGPTVESLRSAGKALEGVHLIGNSTDVPAWLRAANVVAFPSRWEGLALAVLEASSTGRSIVASNAAGMSEVLGDEGGAVVPLGADFSANFATALRDRLLHVTTTDLEGFRGHERVSSIFDIKGALASTAEETLRVCKKGPSDDPITLRPGDVRPS